MEFDRQPEVLVQLSGSQPMTALSIQNPSSRRTTAGAYGTWNGVSGGRHTTVQL